MNFLFASCWWVRDAVLLQSLISSVSWKQYIKCPCSVGVRCCSAFLRPACAKRGWMISVYKTWFRLQWKLLQPLCWGLRESSYLHFSLKHFKPKKKTTSVLWLSCSSSSSCWTGLSLCCGAQQWAVFIIQQVFHVGAVWRIICRWISLCLVISACIWGRNYIPCQWMLIK